MANAPAFARIKSDVHAIVRRIPAGRVATHGQIGKHLTVSPRHIAHLLTTLDDADRLSMPWWRVVADGGAIGRHFRRDDQIANLRADGLLISPVGIVQDLAERRMANLQEQPSGIIQRADPAPPAAPLTRSRGMKGKPTSTV